MTSKGGITEFLRETFSRGRAAHAYIVVAEKQRLTDLLKRCAKICMCHTHTAADGCDACKKVQLNVHQDVWKFPRDEQKGRITVADMSTLVEESYKRPIDGGDVRVFLVDASSSVAGVGSEIWQNKLLKTLEEPNENVYVFIGVTDAESLLPTVRSRCQIIRQIALTPQEVADALSKKGYQKKYCEVAASVCNDVETAESALVNPTIMKAFQNALDWTTEMTSTKNALKFVAPVLSDKDSVLWFLKFLTVLLRESVIFRLTDRLSLLPSLAEDVEQICKNYSLQAAEVCIEKVNSAKKRLDDGGNAAVVLDQLASCMLEVKYRCRI